MKKVLSVILSLVLLLVFIPVGASAQTAPTVTVVKVRGTPGSTVDVKISIENNPGIMAMSFCVTYDRDVFEYVGYTEGYLTNYNIKDHSDKGYVSFVNIETEDKADNGTMLTLSFKIKTTAAEGEYVITLANGNPTEYANSLHNSFANSKEQYIVPEVNSGSITVSDAPVVAYGDVNGDGNINNRDYALLMQYINKWNVEIIEYAADVNADGAINNRDYALLMQFINKWDVKLG